ncbi:hypothetical protein [Sphingobium sp. SYK-6]|uniref:hypothetical protein n=1 Tax=Sphingobium sp. (strain NBRC 103272 / SYK-6) TaxID=627192 RepID=UPI0011D28432|nr:hypothetical protein [Sphingobium sp. SYK-6]
MKIEKLPDRGPNSEPDRCRFRRRDPGQDRTLRCIPKAHIDAVGPGMDACVASRLKESLEILLQQMMPGRDDQLMFLHMANHRVGGGRCRAAPFVLWRPCALDAFVADGVEIRRGLPGTHGVIR